MESTAFSLCSGVLSQTAPAQIQQGCGQNGKRRHQRDEPVFGKARDQVAGHTGRHDDHGVLHLGLHVVDVVRLCTGAGHDGRIRDRRNMVAADSTRQHRGYRHDHHGGVRLGEHIDDDGDQNRKRAPAGAGGERNKNRNAEDQQRHKAHETLIQADGLAHKVADAQRIGHALQRPGQHQNQDGRHHQLAALGHGVHEVLKANNAARQVEQQQEAHRDKARKDKRLRRGAVGKVLDKVRAAVQVAGPDHRGDGRKDHDDHRCNQVNDLALGEFTALGGVLDFLVLECLPARGEQVTVGGVALVLFHQAEVEAQQRGKEHHVERQHRVQVERDRADEHLKAGHRAARRDVGVDRRRPGRDRRNDADRGRRGVDEVSQLGAGNLVLVGNRAHDGADGQAVEVVVHKNQRTQQRGRHERGALALELFRRPLTVSAGAAGLLHEHNDHAQQDHEHQNREVDAVDHRVEQCVKRDPGVKLCHQQRTQCTAGEQREIDFLCEQRQQNGDDRRHQGPPSSYKHFLHLFLFKIFLCQLRHCAGKQQQRNQVRDAHQTVEGIGNAPHQAQVHRSTQDGNEGVHHEEGAHDLVAAAKECNKA